MTTKYVFDGSAHIRHRVVGYAHTWEELGPGIRVRRRIVGLGPVYAPVHTGTRPGRQPKPEVPDSREH